MLVLSRKEKEGLTILLDGKVVQIVISEVNGQQIKIGIEAPKDVQIIRTELLTKSKRTQGQKANSKSKKMALDILEKFNDAGLTEGSQARK